MADLAAGLVLAQGILVALLERERSGRGQRVTTSLLQAMIQMLDFQATRWLIDGEVPPQAGNDHPTTTPTGVFQTRDGSVNIAATTQAMWVSLCTVLGRPDLAADPRFARPADRRAHREELRAALDSLVRDFDSASLIDALNEAGVPAGPILTVREAFEHEQVRAMRMTAPVTHPQLGELELLGVPYRLSRTPGAVRSAAPDPGEHSDAVLAELGYGEEERRGLREAGVT